MKTVDPERFREVPFTSSAGAGYLRRARGWHSLPAGDSASFATAPHVDAPGPLSEEKKTTGHIFPVL